MTEKKIYQNDPRLTGRNLRSGLFQLLTSNDVKVRYIFIQSFEVGHIINLIVVEKPGNVGSKTKTTASAPPLFIL